MAEGEVAKEPVVLESLGLGSCVAICLYDPVIKAGGLAHTMLPTATTLNNAEPNAEEREKNSSVVPREVSRSSAPPVDNVYRYADTAIDSLVAKLKNLGSSIDRLEAKLVGGSNMFEASLGRKESDRIGEETAEKAKQKLAELGIKVVADDTGGTIGRSAHFNLTNGIVEVSTKM